MTLDILSQDEVAHWKKLVDDARNIVVCCHKGPDGDAIGSMLGLAEYLRNQGKAPMLVAPDAYPDFLKWMPCIDRVLRYDRYKTLIDEALQKADLVFCLDFNHSGRLMDMQSAFDACQARRILVDHHLDPCIDAEVHVSRPDMSSTCELLFRILHQLGEYDNMTRLGAVPIYCGMMTDTGGFTYNSSRPEIFYIISLLLAKKVDKDKIYRNVFNNYSEWAMRMRGFVMCHKLNVVGECHAAYFALTKADMKRFHFVKGDAEGLVNEPLRIKNIRLSVSLREDTERPNTVWVSMRSVDHYHCNTVAEKFFNGGGHPNAAGGHLYCSIEEAEQITHKAILYFSTLYPN